MSRIYRDLANTAQKNDGPGPESTLLPPTMQALRHARSAVPKGRSPHVAVVGAGFAGLRCADILSHAGIKVTLFEARDRIGGRVHQVESGGHLMDMGPNWIHGTKGNPIMELAEQTGTTVMEPEEEAALFDATGTRRSDVEAVELSGKIWEMVVGAFKYSDDHSATIDAQTSLFDYFKDRLAKEDISDTRRQDLLHEAQMWGPFVGDPVEKQSLKFFFLEECIEGENVFVASTYKDILREVGRPVTDPAKVDLRLNTEIVHVDTSVGDESDPKDGSNQDTGPQGTNTDSSRHEINHCPEPKVTLTTSTGKKCTFDQVVITCPLGWLKRHHASVFTPALPSRLSAAIEHINYGRLEKLYVTFPTAFWLTNQRSPRSETADETGTTDLLEGSHPDSTSDSSPSLNTPELDLSTYPVFTHFHNPLYIPHPASEPWNQSVVSLAHLPPPHAHPTLLFYIYGPCATHVVNSIQNLIPHSAEYDASLTAFGEPFYSRLPNYSSSDPACIPSSLLMTQWQADKYAGNGSYSNFQVGLEQGDQDIEVMRYGAEYSNGLSTTDCGLWFAGEHTAPFIALGTTTGAWWSGEGVARRICERYGIEVDIRDPSGELAGEAEAERQKKDLDSSKPDAANVAGLAI